MKPATWRGLQDHRQSAKADGSGFMHSSEEVIEAEDRIADLTRRVFGLGAWSETSRPDPIRNARSARCVFELHRRPQKKTQYFADAYPPSEPMPSPPRIFRRANSRLDPMRTIAPRRPHRPPTSLLAAPRHPIRRRPLSSRPARSGMVRSARRVAAGGVGQISA
jgi:hypothetical protein